MTPKEMKIAVENASAQLRAADQIAQDIGYILIGRLRQLTRWQLRQLKKEIDQFNSKTGEWK